MTQYFSHAVEIEPGEEPKFVIRERPKSFELGGKVAGYSASNNKRAVWQAARSQSLGIMFVPINGETIYYGVHFDAPTFERAVYRGYISYGLSMTDGVYHPIKFEQWVIHFRQHALADREVFNENDVAQYVKDSLPHYVKLLAERVHVIERHDADPSKQRGTQCRECRGNF